MSQDTDMGDSGGTSGKGLAGLKEGGVPSAAALAALKAGKPAQGTQEWEWLTMSL